MELSVLILLALSASALGWFWVNGLLSGERRMRHRSWNAPHPFPVEEEDAEANAESEEERNTPWPVCGALVAEAKKPCRGRVL